MRFKLTLLLLLANLAVFFVLWRLNRPPPIEPKASGPVARDFTPDRILINDHARNEVREIKRDTPDSPYRIVQPFDWPANEFAVRAIYSNLQELDVGANITPEELRQGGQNLKDFGLDQPILEVTLADATHTQTLLVGKPTARGENIYAMNPADKIVRVIAQSALASLFAPIEDLRDDSIFTTQGFDAQSLSIKSPNLVKFVKDGDVWWLDTPLRRPADTENVNRVISALDDLKVQRFLTPAEAADATRLGLAESNYTVELQGETSQTLHVGADVPDAPAAAPEVYGQMEGSKVVFTLSKKGDLFTKILPQAQDLLRQRHFLDFDPTKVTTLSVKSPESEVIVDHLANQTWQVRDKDSAGQPHPFDADTATVQALLMGLENLAAKNFASDAPGDLAPFGLAVPWRTVALHTTDQVLTVDLGETAAADATAAPHYYAKVEGADTVYELDGAVFNQLEPQMDAEPLHFRDRVLESLPASAQITTLKLSHLTDNQDIYNGTLPDNTTWDKYLPNTDTSTSARRTALLDLLNYVKKFVVQDYRAAAFTDDYQQPMPAPTPPVELPWRFRLDAVVQIPAEGATPGQNKTLSFYFTDALHGSQQIGGAKEPAPGAIFDLAPGLIFDLGMLTPDANRPAVVTQILEQVSQPINPLPGPPAATPAPGPAPVPVEPATNTPPPAAPTPVPPVTPTPAATEAAPAGSAAPAANTTGTP